ncbi:DUF453-domain-containing protein [Corynespora cassiicola Philippines]|uniref:DUF453-domain-containing protein n=1 Tax=Corynespora cassiicola Philippines TaxID=1448308 RepID=A0A2T2NE03_CORCC|nr:DUF453-domain-containing protein [Corynespora cassiicola Philippines]
MMRPVLVKFLRAGRSSRDTSRSFHELAATSRESNETTDSAPEIVRAAYHRAGTSRTLIVPRKYLVSVRKQWPTIMRQLSELDGLDMSARPTKSANLCIIDKHRSRYTGTPLPDDPHLEYTFVGQAEGSSARRKALPKPSDRIAFSGNGEDLISVLGSYAYKTRLLPRRLYDAGSGERLIRITNTNTGKVASANVLIEESIGPDTAKVFTPNPSVTLEFLDPYGSRTGKLLPTGKKRETIAGYLASCVDGSTPCVFVRADDLGLDGDMLPADLGKQSKKLDLLERIRMDAALAMGMTDTRGKDPRTSTLPIVGIVSMSSTHTLVSGDKIRTHEMDLVVRFFSGLGPVHGVPLSAVLTTAIAATIPGTIPEQFLAPDRVFEDSIIISHAGGKMRVQVTMGGEDGKSPLSATTTHTSEPLTDLDISCVPEDDLMYATLSKESKAELSLEHGVSKSKCSRKHSSLAQEPKQDYKMLELKRESSIKRFLAPMK